MADHLTYLRYAFAVLLCAPFACGDKYDHPGDARVLDVACARTSVADAGAPAPTDGCQLSRVGAAKVSGLTADSVGLRLGPEDGSVTIVVPPLNLPGSDDTWTYEVLARGRGSFQVSCPTSSPAEAGTDAKTYDPSSSCIANATPTGSFEWIPVGAEGRVGTAGAGRTTPKTPITLSVKGGSTLEIVDIRIVSSERPKGCS
jgi:hypothetical protein